MSIHGDGRFRVMATYGEYVSKIANGNVGDASSPAGSPSYLYWSYEGPNISAVPTRQALQQMWDWFQGVVAANPSGEADGDFALNYNLPIGPV